MPPTRAMLAEFVGTFALTFVGGGAIILTHALPGGGGGLVAVALAHGIILAVMVSATMHISGGQINPAVSVALGVIGKQRWGQAGQFIAAQVAGSVGAALLLRGLLGSLPAASGSGLSAVEAAKLGATLGGMGLPPLTVLPLEAIGTFFLMFVVMGTAVDRRGVGGGAAIGGFGIGLTVAADILCLGPLTGASVNPARSFGPALVGGFWEMHWVYWVGPIAGAALAAAAYRTTFGDKAPPAS